MCITLNEQFSTYLTDVNLSDLKNIKMFIFKITNILYYELYHYSLIFHDIC